MTVLLLALFACSSDPRSTPSEEERTPATPSVVPSTPPSAPPASEPSTPASPRASGPPSRFEVYRAFLAEHATPLSEGESCDGVVGVELARAPTLGDWIAYNLSVVDEVDEDGAITLPVECHAAEAHEGEWDCTVEFAAGQGGESPWKWGVRGRIRDADGTLVARSWSCVGAG
jgi:hypothetical protein